MPYLSFMALSQLSFNFSCFPGWYFFHFHFHCHFHFHFHFSFSLFHFNFQVFPRHLLYLRPGTCTANDSLRCPSNGTLNHDVEVQYFSLRFYLGHIYMQKNPECAKRRRRENEGTRT